MLRFASAGGVLLVLASPATAQQWTGGVAWGSGPGPQAGLVAEAQASSEEAGVGRWDRRFAAGGLAVTLDGWKATATGGQFTYSYTGGGDGAAPLVSFGLTKDIADVLHGTVSLELRRTMLWDAGQRLDIDQARLGWTLRY